MEICRKNLLFIRLGFFMFLFSQVSDVSSATTDTISTVTPLVGLKTIVSSGDIFELGLFSPNPDVNGYVYIGIWYRQVSPRAIVWVANRESPFQTVILGSLFERTYDLAFLIIDGNLILSDTLNNNETIWSTGVNASRSKDVRAVLLDNGNLVLRDGPTSSAAVLWQSFDHPSDTWLRGAKFKLGSQLTSWKSLTDPSPGRYSLVVDPNTTHSLIMVWNRSKQYWSSGTWNQFGFSYLDGSLRFKLNQNESYITYLADTDSTDHLVMDVSGRLLLYDWSVELKQLSEISSQPRDKCAVYNFCGSFGICNETQEPTPCRCVPGFRQSINHQSDSNDFSGGCERETKLQCGKGNVEFLPIKNMKLATDPTTTLVLTASFVTTCASTCLANCSCNAYAYDGKKCLIWTTNAFNLQQLDGNKGHTFFLRVASSNISPAASGGS